MRHSSVTAQAVFLALCATALSQTAGKARPPLQDAASAASSTNSSGPRIQFATTLWDFGREKAGTSVKYSYVFTNCGDRLLEVKSVQPGCGCAAAGEWSKQVEPGKAGTIPIQLNSASLNGPVSKTVTVTCNDPTTPEVTLQIKGTVWKPVEVNPSFAFFRVTPESHSAVRVVRIINNEEEPLTLSTPESDNRAFAVELRTNQPGKEFRLVIKTVPPLPLGRVQGKITVKTSSTNAPVLTVTPYVFVRPIIAATPPQFSLPAPGPLPPASLPSVMIQNNSTNAVALSDASINAKDVRVGLQVLKPGRLFRATLTLPPGFELPQGQQVEVTLKSSNPLCPLVKVPVIQAAPPAVPSAPSSPEAPVPQTGEQ